jgi:hypothetical protein
MVLTNQLTRNQIIEAALRKLAVLAEGQTPSAQNYTDAQISLNMTLSQFRTLGMPLWTRMEYTFLPTAASYSIGTGQTLNTPYPVKLLQAYRTESNTRVEMNIVNKEEYNILPASSTGTPIKISYQPNINSGVVYLWPTPPATNTAYVTLVYLRSVQYTSLATDTIDMPEEWYMALVLALAVSLAPEWGIPLPDRQWLEKQAEKALEAAAGVGQDVGSFFVQPAREQ